MLCLCYPRPLSSTQLLLHSVGCCYDTTWKMTLEVNTQTQKSCYVFTHSVFFLLCMVDTIEKSCAHQSGVKPYWDCFAVSTLHNAAVVNINHTHTHIQKKQTLDLLMKHWNTHVSTGCSFSWVDNEEHRVWELFWSSWSPVHFTFGISCGISTAELQKWHFYAEVKAASWFLPENQVVLQYFDKECFIPAILGLKLDSG